MSEADIDEDAEYAGLQDDDDSSDSEYEYCTGFIEGFSSAGINSKQADESQVWQHVKKRAADPDHIDIKDIGLKRCNAVIYLDARDFWRFKCEISFSFSAKCTCTFVTINLQH